MGRLGGRWVVVTRFGQSWPKVLSLLGFRKAVPGSGGAGADTITTGTGSDRITYTAAGQGGNTIDVATATPLTAGDTINAFATTLDDIVVTNAVNGVGAAAAAGGAGTWNLNTNGAFVLTGVNFDVTAATTADDIAGQIGNVTGDANDRAFIAIFDGNGAGTADDQFHIFQVTLNNVRAGAAIAGTDTISLVGSLTTTAFVAGDFII